MASPFDQNFMQGVNMAFNAAGIQDQRQRMMLQAQFQQAQMQHMEMQNKLIEEQIKKSADMDTLLKTPLNEFLKPEMKNVPAPSYEPGQGMPPYRPGATIQQPTGRQNIQIPPNATLGMAKQLMDLKRAMAPEEWHPGSEEEAIRFEQAKQGLAKPTVVSQGSVLVSPQGNPLFTNPAKPEENAEVKKMEAFEQIYPSMGGKRGTADYADAYNKWKNAEESRLRVGLQLSPNIFIGQDVNANPLFIKGRGNVNLQPGVKPEGGLIPKPSAITQPAMEDLTQGIQALRDLKVMEDNVSESGGLSGIFQKGLLNVPGLRAFDFASDKARAFQTAKDRIRLSAQSMIKGIPSNYDVQIVLDTLADLAISEKTNKQRLMQTRNAYTSILKDTIAFHKGSGQIIPPFIINSAKIQGVNIDSIKAWDGVSDPFEETAQKFIKKGSTGGLGTTPMPKYKILKVE